MLEFVYNVFRYVSCMAAFLCNTILVYYVQHCVLCRVTSFAMKLQKKGCYSYNYGIRLKSSAEKQLHVTLAI